MDARGAVPWEGVQAAGAPHTAAALLHEVALLQQRPLATARAGALVAAALAAAGVADAADAAAE
eukprot:3023428-Prymnesium_polylepis.1